jgi:hypothetical protein
MWLDKNGKLNWGLKQHASYDLLQYKERLFTVVTIDFGGLIIDANKRES